MYLTGCINTTPRPALKVFWFVFPFSFFYFTLTFQIFSSLGYWSLSISLISPIFTSLSSSIHFEWCINLGTCDISQFSNQQSNISLCFRRSLFRLLTASKDPTELWSLLCSSLSPFSVIKSRLSKSPVMLPKPKRRLLMMFNISATKVSHYRTEKLWFSKFSSVVSLIWQIFLSTLPWIWWAAPEHTLYSSFILE